MKVRERALQRAFLIAIAFLIIGLLTYVIMSGTPMRYHDEREYLDIARGLSNGDGFELNGTPTAYRPPIWPIILAFFLKVGVPQSMLAVVSASLMAMAALVAGAVAVRLSRSPWGWLAGATILAYPINVYTAVTLYPQSVATLLVVSLWLVSLHISDDRGRRQASVYILAGLLAASLALAVPTLAFTSVVILIWAMVTAHGDRVRAVLWIIASFAIPMSAWAIRNFLALGAPVFLSTSGGANLLIGNNPSATGSSGVNVRIDQLRDAASNMNEVAADRYLRDAAFDWIIHHPKESLALYFAKLVNYFAPYNEPVTVSEHSIIQRLVAYISFALVITFVVVRLILALRNSECIN